MSIDSTAQLLFNIGANSDDAEANIARFRTLLGTDLDEMEAQFDGWAKDLVGEIGTVQAAMTAGGAIIGASLVAIGAASMEAADKYAEYVGQVARGSKTTGIAIEDMSGLKFAAGETGTSYDALVTGLTRFATTVDKANQGGDAQQKMFARLGISQDQVKAGESDMMPLLMSVADSFEHMSSKTERAALARDLFGRGGAELVSMLGQGSEGLRKFAEEAKKLGLVLSPEDRDKLREYKAALEAIKNQHEALEVTVGRTMLPFKTGWEAAYSSLLEVIFATGIWRESLIGLTNPGFALEQIAEKWRAKFKELNEQIQELAKSLDHVGDKPPADPLEPLAKSAKDAKEAFYGFTDLLDQVRQRTAGLAGEDEKLVAEMSHMQLEIKKTGERLQELQKAGKIDPATANREIEAFVAANAEIARLAVALSAQAAEKAGEIQQQFSEDIARRLAAQGEKSFEGQVAGWDREIQGLKEKLDKEKKLSVDAKAELLEQLNQLQSAGVTKIWREYSDEMTEAYADLDRRTEEQSERTYAQQVASWNREIDALAEQFAKKAEFEGQYDDRIAALRKAGLDKIDADQSAAYTREMTGLQARLGMMLNAEATRAEKLQDTYQKDLRAFSDAEQAKVLLTAKGSAERAATENEFAALRSALLVKYNTDLQGLENSQGWQGVFGAKFGQMLKGNEALEKQWATSSNQSLLMVKVSLENLKEMGQQAFTQMAQGMGAGIANAIVYQKSVGAAMEAVLKSTLESLAAQAFAHAIFSTALGFQDIAEYNYAGATAAFQAAAMFALVGAAAGVAGRAIPGGGGGSGASGSGSGSGSGGGSDKGASTGQTAAPASTGPHVVVNIQGHVIGTSGVQELTSMINDAVLNRDVQLTSTNTKTGQVVNQ